MKPAVRFWPLATLILLPVLVLAVVAAYGLVQRRKAQRTEAAALCEARPLIREWGLAMDEVAMSSPPVVLYDDPPAPSLVLETALHPPLAELDDAALLVEMRSISSNRQISSGLPPRVLAGWEWLTRQLAPDHAAPPLEEVEFFMRVVLVECPSAISPVILERLAQQFPAEGAAWRKTWNLMELKRAVLRHAAPVYAPGRIAPLQSLVLPAPDATATGLPAEMKHRLLSDAPGIALEERPGTVAMVFPRIPGEARVLLEGELRAAFQTMRERTSRMLPPWAAVNISIKPSTAMHDGIGLRLAQLGDPLPEVLSRVDDGLIAIMTGPRERDWLLRDFHKLVWWAAGIIGGAFLIALLGLWLIRRTLTKERRLGQLKSQFVSSVSHELRAPVGSLRLMAEGLASGKVSGTAADEFHRLMAGEGARLSSLIENVLDFARIEQGRKEYHMAETDIAALVQDAVKLMSPQVEARGLRIVYECEALPFVPHVDAGAVQQALINLLDNAIKFSPANAARHSNVESAPDSNLESRATIRVSLAADPSRNSWSLAVTDHGPGIPREEHARIFERFYRLGNELRRETTGTGIGLALVKHIVEGHGGTVSVHSAPGAGSTFRMQFPALARAWRQPARVCHLSS